MAFLDDLKQGLSDVTKTVYEKSGQFVEIQKLKMKRNSLNSELKAAYVEIGKMVYEEKKAGAEFSGPVIQLCQKIDMGLEAIQEVDEQIEEVRARATVEDGTFDENDIFEEDVKDVTVEEVPTEEDAPEISEEETAEAEVPDETVSAEETETIEEAAEEAVEESEVPAEETKAE